MPPTLWRVPQPSICVGFRLHSNQLRSHFTAGVPSKLWLVHFWAQTLAQLNGRLAAKSQPVIRQRVCAGAPWWGLDCSTSEPCGQRCHPGDSLRYLEGSFPSSFLPSSLFLFCSSLLVIENVFIAGPEAGLGRGRCCGLWRCGWGKGRRVWLFFNTTNSLMKSIFLSLSALFVYCSLTSNFSLFVHLFFQCPAFHFHSPAAFILCLSLSFLIGRVWGPFQMQMVLLGLMLVMCCQ